MTEMDTLTLDELMHHYGQDVWNFAFFLTRNRSLADDIAQDVFLKAYVHIESFRAESSVKTWLLRITRNIALNYRKSAFFRKVLLVDTVRAVRQGMSAEQAFFDREATNEVWRQVFRLSAKHREVLILHAKHQLSLQDIADILGVPIGTVKSRLFTARKKLTALLEEEIVYEMG